MEKDTKEKRTARVTVAIPPSQKKRWLDAAEARHWTITTLIEQAVERFLAG